MAEPTRPAESILRGERAPLTLPAKRVRRILRHGNVEALEMIPWSSNYTFAVKLKLEGEPETIAVYKPKRGETPLWDFPSGTLYKREYAAYLASRILGWQFVPFTVVRDGPYGVGTMQLFVDHDRGMDFFQFKEAFTDQLQRIALFDLITNNADRKSGHCLKGLDGTIWGIDHGLTFHPQMKLRTVLWDWGGEPIPEPLLEDLERFTADAERCVRMRAVLTELLDPIEVEIFFERIQRALEIRAFPMMGSRRSVPWPWH